MTPITLKNKVNESTHVLILTEKFINEFNLPDKVNDYIVGQLSQKDKKTLTYNYIGRYISIMVIEKKTSPTGLPERVRRHGATVADAVNAHKGKEGNENGKH